MWSERLAKDIADQNYGVTPSGKAFCRPWVDCVTLTHPDWRTSSCSPPSALKNYKQKDLAQMAKQRGISGWHAMRKEQLVKALLSSTESETKTTTVAKSKAAAKPKPRKNGVTRRIQAEHARREQKRDLTSAPMTRADGSTNTPEEDRIVLMVRDPYWLARLLGTHRTKRAASKSRFGSQLARGQARHSADRQIRKHVGTRQPCDRNPWRREELVHRH